MINKSHLYRLTSQIPISSHEHLKVHNVQHLDLGFSTVLQQKEAELDGEMADSRLRQEKYNMSTEQLVVPGTKCLKILHNDIGMSKRYRNQRKELPVPKAGTNFVTR